MSFVLRHQKILFVAYELKKLLRFKTTKTKSRIRLNKEHILKHTNMQIYSYNKRLLLCVFQNI
jgi:hypothetical protein